ncbi:16S rRNA pseudouridine(516) synthase [Paraferrimonas haliotis]|uniref:Pseudouridine synthase n=1 Tax=Paraferrimonas haliotis TaxID=2013866 RepID=A0AA37TUX8_9GAMM|nr:pseudouridine synthase [Paraferrimonas haliotis]GLS84676.1 pseudouridine synthase [Paraferrimonas haliotis]
MARGASYRLDRWLSKQLSIPKKDARRLLAASQVTVNGAVETNADRIVNELSCIALKNQVLQQQQAHYVILHKPAGVVSATRDNEHTTVIDLIDAPFANTLHLAGRLDKNTTGLVLLSNDGRWTRQLTEPTSKLYKHYHVTLQNPIDSSYVDAFAKGMYFEYEGVSIKPAKLVIESTFTASLSIEEGRYHQIKRMFGRFRNPVVALHRYAVGDLHLPEDLAAGQWRELSESELALLMSKSAG